MPLGAAGDLLCRGPSGVPISAFLAQIPATWAGARPHPRWSGRPGTSAFRRRLSMADTTRSSHKGGEHTSAGVLTRPAEPETFGVRLQARTGDFRAALSLAEGLVESVAGSTHGANRIALALP